MKTSTKKIAYDLFLQGNSYRQIAKQLNISISTAHNVVKEMKLKSSGKPTSDKGNRSERSKRSANERTETNSPEDKNNYAIVCNTFSFNSSTEQLMDFLRNCR